MSDLNGRYSGSIPAQADMSVDAGLRAFMLGIYNKMGLGLALAAGLAWVTGTVPEVRDLFYQQTDLGFTYTTLGSVVRFLPIGILLISMFAMRNPSARGASLLYWGVVASFGLGLGVVFIAYPTTLITSTFLITAASFGALSLIGYTTKKDLSGFGSFLTMGLIGLILVSIVNMFLNSPMMYFIINVAGVLIFAGLTAWDTQKLKLSYYALRDDSRSLAVMTSYGALTLFLDFLNMFLFLLRLFGGRR